ncbi:MAG: hypothetical protein IJ423_05500 [Clostridia bacterium]|nr:hypothetical protein [Clostridia bacterium]MBQ8637425.1 hypothetical protein [Clostridia bacterium]
MNELSTLPTYEAKSFMLWVAKATEAYFENPDVKRRFEEWKKERELNAHRKNCESRNP